MHEEHHVYAVVVEPAQKAEQAFARLGADGVYVQVDVAVRFGLFAVGEQRPVLYPERTLDLLLEFCLQVLQAPYVQRALRFEYGGALLYIFLDARQVCDGEPPVHAERVFVEKVLVRDGDGLHPTLVYVGEELALVVAELELQVFPAHVDRVIYGICRAYAHQVVDDGLVYPGCGLFLEKVEHVASL